MYICYLQDRKKLGFTCMKDDHAANQISDLKDFIKRTTGISVASIIKNGKQIIKKGKQLFIIVISKEVLVAIFIFVNSNSVSGATDVFLPSFEVNTYHIHKLNDLNVKKHLKSLTSPSSMLYSKLNQQRYSIGKLNKREKREMLKLKASILAKSDKLRKSMIAKSKGHYAFEEQVSINKELQQMFNSLMLDPTFWKILSLVFDTHYIIPMPELADRRFISFPNVPRLGPSPDVPRLSPLPKVSRLGPLPNVSRLGPLPNFYCLSPLPNAPYNQLTALSRLSDPQSINPQNIKLASFGLGFSFSEDSYLGDVKSREELTQLRRAEPLYESKVLGPSYFYGEKQLEQKGGKHLERDYGVSIKGKNSKQVAVEYYNCNENILQKKNLIHYPYGTMNKQESANIYGDPESKFIVAFENDILSDNKFFISGYKVSQKAFDEFRQSGNVGMTKDAKKILNNSMQKEKAKRLGEKENVRSFYHSLSPDAKITKEQLQEVKMLKLKRDSNYKLTEKEERLLKREEKYQQHKQEFFKNNPNIFDEEL